MNQDQFIRQVKYNGWIIDLFHDPSADTYSAQIDRQTPMIPECEIYPFKTMGDALIAAMINVDYFNLDNWQERSVDEFAREWVSGHGGDDADYRELPY